MVNEHPTVQYSHQSPIPASTQSSAENTMAYSTVDCPRSSAISRLSHWISHPRALAALA